MRDQFIENYAKGALDGLVWKELISDSRASSLRACASGTDAQLRAIECGYAEGIAATLERRIPVTIEDFGYQKTSINARVSRASDGGQLFVQAAHEKAWLIAPSPAAEQLKLGDCYRMTGYRGATGALGSNHAPYSRAFIVLEVAPSKSCDFPAAR